MQPGLRQLPVPAVARYSGGSKASGGSPGSAGATQSGGTTGSGDTTGSGGTTGRGGATATGGATSTGGVTGSGGVTGFGGAAGSVGGGAAGSVGGGGSGIAGWGGTGGSGVGGTGGSGIAMPSPGCGKTSTLTFGTVPGETASATPGGPSLGTGKGGYVNITSGGQQRGFAMRLPDNYDNNHPYWFDLRLPLERRRLGRPGHRR